MDFTHYQPSKFLGSSPPGSSSISRQFNIGKICEWILVTIQYINKIWNGQEKEKYVIPWDFPEIWKPSFSKEIVLGPCHIIYCPSYNNHLGWLSHNPCNKRSTGRLQRVYPPPPPNIYIYIYIYKKFTHRIIHYTLWKVGFQKIATMRQYTHIL